MMSSAMLHNLYSYRLLYEILVRFNHLLVNRRIKKQSELPTQHRWEGLKTFFSEVIHPFCLKCHCQQVRFKNILEGTVLRCHAETLESHLPLGKRTHILNNCILTIYATDVMLWPLHFHYTWRLSVLHSSLALAHSFPLALRPVRLQVRLSPFHSHLLGLYLCLTVLIAPLPRVSWLIPW